MVFLGGKGLSPRWSGGKNPWQSWVTSKWVAFQAKKEEWRALPPTPHPPPPNLTKNHSKVFYGHFLRSLKGKRKRSRLQKKKKKII